MSVLPPAARGGSWVSCCNGIMSPLVCKVAASLYRTSFCNWWYSSSLQAVRKTELETTRNERGFTRQSHAKCTWFPFWGDALHIMHFDSCILSFLLAFGHNGEMGQDDSLDIQIHSWLINPTQRIRRNWLGGVLWWNVIGPILNSVLLYILLPWMKTLKSRLSTLPGMAETLEWQNIGWRASLVAQ